MRGIAAAAAAVISGCLLALFAQVGQSARLTVTSSPYLSAVQRAAVGAIEALDGVPGMSVGSASALVARPAPDTPVTGRLDVSTWSALRAAYFVPGSSADRYFAGTMVSVESVPSFSGTGGVSAMTVTTRAAGFGHAVVLARVQHWVSTEGATPSGSLTVTLSLSEHSGRWRVTTMSFSDLSPV